MSSGDLINGINLDGGVLGQGLLTASAARLTITVNNTDVTVVPAYFWVVLKKVIFTNTDTVGRTLTYGILKAGGTVGAAGSLQCVTFPMGAAGTTTHIVTADELGGALLGPGDSIVAYADVTAKVAWTVDGTVSH